MTTPADRLGRWGPFDPLVPAVALVSFVTYALHGTNGSLSRDLSVYVYAGQRLVDDGVPPYVGILNRSGPFAHLLPAVGTAVARAFGGDDLAGARWFYLVLSVLCVCVVYLLGRDLFASRLVGLTAAAAFLSFAGFIEYASDGPREKTPMVLFMLLALWAATRGRWFWAGLCLSLTTLTLQIGFFVAAPYVLLALLLAPRRVGRLAALLRVVLGGVVPVAVLTAYFASVGALRDAVDGFLVINLHYTVANPMTDNFALRWLLLERGFGVSLCFLLAGLAALLVLAPAALVPRLRRAFPPLVSVAALGVATLGGLYWTVRDWIDVGKQRVMLEHRVDVALVRRHPRDVGTLQPDGALGRGLEAGDHPQGGRLAAARRTEHGEELARTDGEVGFVDGHVVGETLGDVVDLNDRAALGAGRPVPSRRVIYGGGVCAGQDETSLTPELAPEAGINNRGFRRPSQAIPQRIYISTMESFVAGADEREIPRKRPHGPRLTVGQPVRCGAAVNPVQPFSRRRWSRNPVFIGCAG